MARPQTKERRRLATIEEVADYLRLDVQTLYHWRSKKRGPKSARVGGRVRYRWDDVDAWVEQQGSRP